jgi:hypothetical protein
MDSPRISRGGGAKKRECENFYFIFCCIVFYLISIASFKLFILFIYLLYIFYIFAQTKISDTFLETLISNVSWMVLKDYYM